MQARTASIDCSLEPESVACSTTEIPLHVFADASFPQIAKNMLLPIVPEHGFAKRQSEWHLVDQSFERGCRATGAGKICVRPGPEVAMAESAVVSLHAEPESVSGKGAAVERDLAGKNRVGMRRSREANPALIAQSHAKCGTVAEIPRHCVAIDCQGPSAGIFLDLVAANSKVKRSLTSAADIQSLQRKSLNQAQRLAARWEPRRPHLNGHALRVPGAAAAPRIHQQVAKPPRPAAVGQSHAEKPDFIAAPDRQ